MAKLLCLVALLLVASAIAAEARTPAAPSPPPAKAPVPAPAPAPSTTKKYPTFALKTIIHNLAERPVTFKLVIKGKTVAKPVVAQAKTWTAIGPVKVGLRVKEVVLYVWAKNNKGVEVKKYFTVKVTSFMKNTRSKSTKALVVTVTEVKEKLGKKKLVVKVGRTVYATLWL